MEADVASPTFDVDAPDREASDRPPVPGTLEETGLSGGFLSDLILRTLYAHGSQTGSELEAKICLPFHILDELFLALQQRQLLHVVGTRGRGRRGYTFDITEEGRTRCRERLETTRYVGPAPVPFDTYSRWVVAQRPEVATLDAESVRAALDHLVLEDEFLEQLGPAIASGRSIFLYGHAGNGKTTIADAIADMLGDAIYVPHAVEVDGQVISIYDPVHHEPVDPAPSEGTDAEGPDWLREEPDHDPRFVRVQRPAVMVGGELQLDELELRYDAQAGVYLAPPQVLANGGVFIIDDFGRQRVRPRDLLNRWMVPLERQVDFLALPSGQRLPMPFRCLLVYATNLDPTELVEEAFLRRIRYKILVDNPSGEAYREIFRRCCEARGVEWTEGAVDQIARNFYETEGHVPRACHPRDIVNHICDLASFRGVAPRAGGKLLDDACRSYFLETVRGKGDAVTSGAIGGLADWEDYDSGMYDG